ncbi:hypothetical protein VTO73DRAFT_11971 [Trametes versicolor]
MSDRVTRKRARTDAGEDDPIANDPPRQRDEEFWYEDGTIILIAGNVEFRIYKGILAEHSPVFKDMFSLPQPPQAAPDDLPCHVVHVSDSPEDLRHVLRIYMAKSDPNPFTRDEPTFDAISATIRLGHKYQIERLVGHSIEYLKQYFTEDLDTWSENDGQGPPGFTTPQAIGLVNLAHLTGETSLLRTAYLTCCKLGANIVDGLVREDGTREHLSMEDLGLCFAAKSRLTQEALANVIYIFAPPVSPTCTNPTMCGAQLALLTKCAGTIFAEPLALIGPFVSIRKIMWAAAERDPILCRHCWALLNRRDVERRTGLWKQLPNIFGLIDGPSNEGGDGAGESDGVAQ